MFSTVFSMAITSPENDKALLNEKLVQEFGKKLEDVTPKPMKFRALKGEKLEQLKFMGDWCITIYEFIKETNPVDPFDFVRNSIYAINKTIESNHFQGMKMVYNDTNEMARGLSGKQLIELNKILHEKFGKSLIDEEKETLKKIDRIIKRGRVNNDEEYYLIQSYIDELIMANDIDRVNKLNRILVAFEAGK